MAQLQSDCDSLWTTLRENPEGLTAPQLLDQGWEKERLRNAAAALKQTRRIDILQHPTQGVVFVAISEDMALRFADLGEEHRAVYKLIADSGTQGVWAKELANSSKIPTGTLTRVTRTLEHRKLIKQITPAQFKSRKVWMLYELEPATELSGGSWYKDGQIDAPLIEQLRSSTMEYISNCSDPVTVEDIQNFIASQGISRSVDSISAIVRTLVLDRELTALEGHTRQAGKDTCYIINRHPALVEFGGLFGHIPCVACPVRKQCFPGHVVSPESCRFIDKWLGITLDDMTY